MDKIYVIKSKEQGCPKIELVNIINVSSNVVKVKSIYDDYEFEYDKEYFMKVAKPATQKDIANYEFSLNK